MPFRGSVASEHSSIFQVGAGSVTAEHSSVFQVGQGSVASEHSSVFQVGQGSVASEHSSNNAPDSSGGTRPHGNPHGTPPIGGSPNGGPPFSEPPGWDKWPGIKPLPGPIGPPIRIDPPPDALIVLSKKHRYHLIGGSGGAPLSELVAFSFSSGYGNFGTEDLDDLAD